MTKEVINIDDCLDGLPNNIDGDEDTDQLGMKQQEEKERRNKLENDDMEARNEFRKDLVPRVKRIVVFYLISTGVIVYLKMMIHDVISDITLGIILGTTTITVLGLPKIILQGLFDVKYPSISSDKSNEK